MLLDRLFVSSRISILGFSTIASPLAHCQPSAASVASAANRQLTASPFDPHLNYSRSRDALIRVIHPDMVAQQIGGAMAFGLTSLLKGQITLDQGRVQQANFDDYPLSQLGEMPDVEVHAVPDERAPEGIGEMGLPPIVPAVVNAIFAATGKRIRHTPLRAGDL